MRKNRSCVPTRKSIWQTLYAVTKEISWLDHLSSIWEHHLSKWSDTDILFWAVRVSGWLVLEVVATQWEVQAVSLSSEMMEWSLLKVLYSFLFTFVCSDNVRVRDDNCAYHKWGGGGQRKWNGICIILMHHETFLLIVLMSASLWSLQAMEGNFFKLC